MNVVLVLIDFTPVRVQESYNTVYCEKNTCDCINVTPSCIVYLQSGIN